MRRHSAHRKKGEIYTNVNMNTIALFILGFAVLYLLVWFFTKPVKFILKAAANSVIGSLCLVLFNYAGSLFGITLGVNLYSSVVCGLLGIPGFLMLVCAKIFIS